MYRKVKSRRVQKRRNNKKKNEANDSKRIVRDKKKV